MDIRIFHKRGGGIIQLIDKKKMEEWSVELPLIFIEYIKEKQLEKLLIEFNKDAEEDDLLDIDIFFNEDEDDNYEE